MRSNEIINRNNEIRSYLRKYGKNDSYRNIARIFNTTEEAVRHIYRKLEKNNTQKVSSIENKLQTNEYIKELENTVTSFVEDFKKGTAEKTVSVSEEIKTLDDLIEKCNIDTSVWSIDKYIQNYWGGKYQVKAYLSKIKGEDKSLQDFFNYLDSYKPTIQKISKHDIFLNRSFSSESCAFIDITDFHLDKLTIDNDSIENRINTFYNIVNKLLFRVYHSFYVDEIVFVVGSDWFHTDSFNNTTTKGTPVENNIPWDNAYELGFDIYATVISKLKQFCNTLKVVLVSGNHDRTKSFYLAHSLSKYFEKEKSIEFDISTANRKIYTYGNTFIGLHHGNCKIDELPLVFAKEFAPQWGQCLYHEVKVGDKHFYMEKEIKGVRIKQIPSLSAPDQWHDDSNFVQNIRAGIVTVYDKEKGKVAEYEERI